MTTRYATVTIANGAAVSSVIAGIRGWRVVGIGKQATWTAADMSFEIDLNGGGTFVKVIDQAGALVKITGISATVAEFYLVPEIADLLTSSFALRVVSTNAASEADVNQGQAVTLEVLLAPLPSGV